MAFISNSDRVNKESVHNMCKATLLALLRCSEKVVDATLRERLRMHARMAVENGFCLNLSDASSELGRLMASCNNRSRSLGWL